MCPNIERWRGDCGRRPLQQFGRSNLEAQLGGGRRHQRGKPPPTGPRTLDGRPPPGPRPGSAAQRLELAPAWVNTSTAWNQRRLEAVESDHSFGFDARAPTGRNGPPCVRRSGALVASTFCCRFVCAANSEFWGGGSNLATTTG
jgi:hypothetical protein